MAVTARNIRVFTLERESLTVTWSLLSDGEDLNTFQVSVWRSEAAQGPYRQVSRAMNANDVDTFQDRGVNLHHQWRTFFYRIGLTKAGHTDFFGSTDQVKVLEGADPGGVIMEPPPDLEAAESIRRFEMVLREFAGRSVLVLSTRTWGMRCGECWDALKRRVTKSDCIDCFGTGLAGGFFKPIPVKCMKPPGKVYSQLSKLFEMQTNDAVMWFSPRARLKPADLIIDNMGRKWEVVAIDLSEKGWARTRQTAQVRELSSTDAKQRVPIKPADWDVDTLTAGAMRQHIRATDIDSYRDAVQRLGLEEEAVFPPKRRASLYPRGLQC